jgi:hypothetical protein
VVDFGEGQKRIAFKVIGYEFDVATDRYDKNWLKVEIAGRGEQAGKQVQSSALLTWELRKLRSFISAGMDGDSLDFMEPELEFRCSEGVIFVDLRHGLRLCSSSEVEIYAQSCSEAWKDQALKALDDLCEKYPVR